MSKTEPNASLQPNETTQEKPVNTSSITEEVCQSNLNSSTSKSVNELEEASSNIQVNESLNDSQASYNESSESAGYESANESAGWSEQLLNNPDWLSKEKHVFILSESGKPVYSRYGEEERLVTLYGLLQALVSIVAADNCDRCDNTGSHHEPNSQYDKCGNAGDGGMQCSSDGLQCVIAGSYKLVFLVRSPLILVAVVAADYTHASVDQLLLQLIYVNSQVEAVSTRAALRRTYAKRRNCDLRGLLGGTDRLITSLLSLLDTEPGMVVGAYQCLPLSQSVRNDVAQAIISACSKIKNVVFGVVVSGLRVVSVVRLKGVMLHPADLHLLCNLVYASDSLRASENWMPICLPQFDPDGYLYGHVSYLSDGCDACLMLLTVEREHFFQLATAKHNIVQRLRRQHVLDKLIAATAPPPPTTSTDATRVTATTSTVTSTSGGSSGGIDGGSDGSSGSIGDVSISGGSIFGGGNSGGGIGGGCGSGGGGGGGSGGGAGGGYNVSAIGCSELRHFVYKNRALAQYTAPLLSPPYSRGTQHNKDTAHSREAQQSRDDQFYRGGGPCTVYRRLQQRLHGARSPLKMIFYSDAAGDHAALGWVTAEFELYVVLEPLTSKHSAVVVVNRVLKYVKQEESRLFMLSMHTF